MKKPKVFFSYKTTNQINGKWYIGIHKGYLDDKYLGSGNLIKKAIVKYGKENFSREILQMYENYTELFAIEKILVNKDVVEDPTSYNIKVGGRGGWDHIDQTGDKNPMKNPMTALKVSDGIKKSITDEERKDRSIRMSALRKNGTIPTHNKGTAKPPPELKTGKNHIIKIFECPYCDAKGKSFIMKRDHFDNCKHKQV